MSHFYASIEGKARTPATRCGSKSSGIRGHLRGWDIGVRVIGQHRDEDNADDLLVIMTRGSNGRGPETLIATITLDLSTGIPEVTLHRSPSDQVIEYDERRSR